MDNPNHIATANDVGTKLLKALGLPDHCLSLTLRIEAGKAVEVDATCYVTKSQFGAVEYELVTGNYKLVAAEDAA